MTKEEQLQQMEKELVELDKLISDQAEAVSQKQQTIKMIAAQRKELTAALEENNAQTHKESREHQVMLHELAQDRLKGVQIRDKCKELRFTIEVDALFAKQPTVWEVLPKRMKHHQDSNESNLVGIDTKEIDIEAVIEQWKQAHASTRPNFSQWDVNLRGCINNYGQAVRNVCEMAVNKRDVPVNVRQQPNMVLDRWLMQPEIMKVWFK